MKIQKLLLVAFTLVLNNNAAEKPSTPNTPNSPLVLPSTPPQQSELSKTSEQESSAEATQKHRQMLRAAVRSKGAEKALFEFLPL